MVHYQCYTCGISATCVLTSSAELAWLDHMEIHAVKDNFGAWTWAVLQLDL
jgi:hypothetical protein